MTDTPVPQVDMQALAKAEDFLGRAVAAAREGAAKATEKGKRIDAAQVHCERIAYLASQLEAVRAACEYVREAAEAGEDASLALEQAAVFTGETLLALLAQAAEAPEDFALPESIREELFGGGEVRAAIASFCDEARLRAVGRVVAEAGGSNHIWLADEDAVMVRDSVRSFAEQELGPIAERIHRHDELVPDSLIGKMAEMGYFGMSAPEQYGGLGMGNLSMIITTEELSRVSLAAGGSLITRPEILTKALLNGGTEDQKARWLAAVSSGELMVGISVTEPDVGSDVASVACRAEPAEVGGRKGYRINGAKAWCTFAGRADVLAVLARTDFTPGSGARGLSLFIVEKDPFDGHEFRQTQPEGGVLEGKADATPGYRGMHSFTLSFENYFVPEENLIGGEKGKNKGFYLQMNGFAAGRLQTGGRACGLAQAALEASAAYVTERRQFGRPLSDFQLTQYKLGRMASRLHACRCLTYRAAAAMDEDERVSLEPAMAKLLSCDTAVYVAQEGQLLHGGWGYAEEYPISRYVVDAQVLPIFEGVKPILELKVIARQLLSA